MYQLVVVAMAKNINSDDAGDNKKVNLHYFCKVVFSYFLNKKKALTDLSHSVTILATETGNHGLNRRIKGRGQNQMLVVRWASFLRRVYSQKILRSVWHRPQGRNRAGHLTHYSSWVVHDAYGPLKSFIQLTMNCIKSVTIYVVAYAY